MWGNRVLEYVRVIGYYFTWAGHLLRSHFTSFFSRIATSRLIVVPDGADTRPP